MMRVDFGFGGAPRDNWKRLSLFCLFGLSSNILPSWKSLRSWTLHHRPSHYSTRPRLLRQKLLELPQVKYQISQRLSFPVASFDCSPCNRHALVRILDNDKVVNNHGEYLVARRS